MWDIVVKTIRLFFTGQWRRIWNELHVRLYRMLWAVLWYFVVPFRKRGRCSSGGTFTRETEYPVAFQSPDHLAPKGTAVNNSTNKKFVLHMDAKLRREFCDGTIFRMLDLGCAGGQTVVDFATLCWQGVGLEGSDFSLKFRRANWAKLANSRLFTCDITKPYQLKLDGQPVRFHLITAWEVLEHIAPPDLAAVFENIDRHLEIGGYLIASTTETSDMHMGLELHQTRWPNQKWREWVETHFHELEPTDVGLRIYQFVRYNFLYPSFLVYRKHR